MLNQTNTKTSLERQDETSTMPTDFIIHTMQGDLESLKSGHTNALSSTHTAPLPTKKDPVKSEPTPLVTSPFNNLPPKQDHPVQTNILPPQVAKPVTTPIPTNIIQKKETPNGKTLYKIIFLIILLAVIAVVGFGFYYVYTSTKSSTNPAVTTENTPSTEQATQQNLPSEEAVIITPNLSKYSLDKPNFLPIDFSSSSLVDLSSQFSKIAEEIKALPASGLYEFIIVDKNDNPIDFKTFAQATKVTLSSNLLGNLTKEFSLFFYNDNGDVRLGLANKTTTTEKTKLVAAMLKQEPTLVSDLNFLFLGSSAIDTIKTFTVSPYSPNNEVVRYLNLNNEKTLSIDYTVTTNNLLISTSKQTLRAVYQKVTSTNNSITKNDSRENTTSTTSTQNKLSTPQ